MTIEKISLMVFGCGCGVPNGNPGTTFTRSIDDSIAESTGAVATPEIVVLELTPEHPFFVLASDGVFEFPKLGTNLHVIK